MKHTVAYDAQGEPRIECGGRCTKCLGNRQNEHDRDALCFGKVRGTGTERPRRAATRITVAPTVATTVGTLVGVFVPRRVHQRRDSATGDHHQRDRKNAENGRERAETWHVNRGMRNTLWMGVLAL